MLCLGLGVSGPTCLGFSLHVHSKISSAYANISASSTYGVAKTLAHKDLTLIGSGRRDVTVARPHNYICIGVQQKERREACKTSCVFDK